MAVFGCGPHPSLPLANDISISLYILQAFSVVVGGAGGAVLVCWSLFGGGGYHSFSRPAILSFLVLGAQSKTAHASPSDFPFEPRARW